MHRAFRQMLFGGVVFVCTIAVAVVGYVLLGWELIDAVYMVIITIFGVGYDEVNPIESNAEKIFTIFVIIAGTSSAVYIVGGFIQMVTEGEVHRALEAQRKTKGIEQLHHHSIICGFGRMGQILAKRLYQSRKPFVIIDRNPDLLETAESLGYLVQVGDAAEEEVLLSVGIERALFLAAVLPEDAVNVFVTLTARGLKQDITILARGEKPTTENKLRLAGANLVVLPAEIGALQMSNYITQPTAFEFFEQEEGGHTLNEMLAQIQLKLTEVDISQNSRLRGRSVGEVQIWGKGLFLVVALRYANGKTCSHPPASQTLSQGDTLMIIGHVEDLGKFTRYESR
ncbi:MAG: potassium channel protein [Phormidium sp. BM_Day4_Bin.17]|nr:potassium channel protein [Phormidium sp. BM_Day4_Bin.17]UCJ13511.1 MAG: TrkA family potassium uptake protein [Phormidium sp. PBR-2020]